MKNKKPQKGFFVTGTDTGVGKTLVSLGLCMHFEADYWKPIQTGIPTDTDYISPFLPQKNIHPSCLHFKKPLSPNQSAKLENKFIDLNQIDIPSSSFLIVEGVGGVLVPLNNKHKILDLIKKIKLPVIVVARSGLGTLNHTLLTLETLKNNQIQTKGVVLSGIPHSQNKKDIEFFGDIPVILELNHLKEITKENVREAFSKINFS